MVVFKFDMIYMFNLSEIESFKSEFNSLVSRVLAHLVN